MAESITSAGVDPSPRLSNLVDSSRWARPLSESALVCCLASRNELAPLASMVKMGEFNCSSLYQTIRDIPCPLATVLLGLPLARAFWFWRLRLAICSPWARVWLLLHGIISRWPMSARIVLIKALVDTMESGTAERELRFCSLLADDLTSWLSSAVAPEDVLSGFTSLFCSRLEPTSTAEGSTSCLK